MWGCVASAAARLSILDLRCSSRVASMAGKIRSPMSSANLRKGMPEKGSCMLCSATSGWEYRGFAVASE